MKPLARMVAKMKLGALVEGANIVRKEVEATTPRGTAPAVPFSVGRAVRPSLFRDRGSNMAK
jgi:hypothetical protein